MIGGCSAELDRQFGATARLELVRVEPCDEPVVDSGFQNASCLIGREDAGLHEHIAKDGEPSIRYRRYHLADHQVEVIVPAVTVFGRDGVGAQERGNQIQGTFPGQALDHAEHLELVMHGETVAALHLDSRGSVSQ